LSTGRKFRLRVEEKLKKYLKKKGIKKVHIVGTEEAIYKYKEICLKGEKVIAFLHTTC
jgi:hypothetical protein